MKCGVYIIELLELREYRNKDMSRWLLALLIYEIVSSIVIYQYYTIGV